MSHKLQLTTKLDQRLLMNQQLKQVITLLQVTTLELKQQVKTWLETNPLLELKEDVNEDDEDLGEYQYHGKVKKSNNQQDSTDALENVASHESLREHLIKQTLDCQWNERGLSIAEAIIDCIDENGYLTMDVNAIHAAIQEESHAELSEIESILKTIQGFDPPGVGARSTKECLLNQLEQCEHRDEAWVAAKSLLSFDGLNVEQLNLKSMMKVTGLNEADLVSAFSLIKTLHLSPGKIYAGLKETIIEPELIVKKVKGHWEVTLANSFLNRVELNKEYQSLIKKNSRDQSFKTIANQLKEAKVLIGGLKRRNDTLLAVAKYIVDKQGDFFEGGHDGMKPMNLSEVAVALNYHESTISRITTGKYMATPRGLFELKYFFPSQVRTVEGRGRSSIAVKAMIEKIIQEESKTHAYSDDEITNYLTQAGITISRRTVTKYREAMKIPSSYERQNTRWMKESVDKKEEA
jgi:RNA polymerase sigma-54 factor